MRNHTRNLACQIWQRLVVAVGYPAGGANTALARSCQEVQNWRYVSPCRCGGVAAGYLAPSERPYCTEGLPLFRRVRHGTGTFFCH